MRHEPAVRGYAVTHPPGAAVPPQPPGWDQLVYARSGVITVETAEGAWVVPPHRAVWVPAGQRHRMVLTGRTSVRNLYFRSGLLDLADTCHAIDVPPVLRELVVHAVLAAPLHDASPRDMRLVGVIGDLLETIPVAPLQLPFPRDPRARAVAEMMRADPASSASVSELAHSAGASRRTIERCFRNEVGTSVGLWRQRMRVLESLQFLASGSSVTDAAMSVGYSTSSAFGAMFLRETGTSPGRYFQ